MITLENLTAGASVRGLPASGAATAATATNAKYGFGRLIILGRSEPVALAKRGRPVVVVMAVEEFERLKALEEAILSNTGLRKEG